MKKIVFLVQGEGRGHIAQSIALKEVIKDCYPNSQIHAFVANNHRGSPPYLKQEYENLYDYDTFEFKYKGNTLCKRSSFWHNLKNLKRIKKSIKNVKNKIKEIKPDLVINFFETITPFLNIKKICPDAKVLSVGRQYYLPFAASGFWANMFIKWTARGSDQVWAMNYFDDVNVPKNYKVFPPLLQKKILEAAPTTEDFDLVYSVNDHSGYAGLKFPANIKIYSNYETKSVQKFQDFKCKVEYLPVSSEFKEDLIRCRSVTCSSGFETTSEAIYLGKVLYTKPTPNHGEQIFNSDYLTKHGLANTSLGKINILKQAELIARIRICPTVIKKELIDFL
tara:strand:+ start:356 stop:1363 length:1008 start_codon:yes stop_codon:yes gene_type:complete